MINGAPAATAPSSTGQSHDAKGRERRAFVTSYAKDNLACAKRGGCSRCNVAAASANRGKPATSKLFTGPSWASARSANRAFVAPISPSRMRLVEIDLST